MEAYVDNFISENAALRRKLQSKSEAVLILSKDLDKCRTERDQYKLMAEQLQFSYSQLKRKNQDLGNHRIFLRAEEKGMTATEALNETLAQNKALRMQVEDLKQRLHDAYGDMKVLRAGNSQYRLNVAAAAASVEKHSVPEREKEELLQQLEALNSKYKQLEADFQSLLDEKEEVVNQRDIFKCKAHRLNYELGSLLKSDTKDSIDIDALVMENRYLQDRLKQVQSEQHAAKQTVVKYKAMLDKKRLKDTARFGLSSAAGMVVSHKQVQQLLEKTAPGQLPNTPATLDQMKSVCLALLESLGDKSLNLAHQKKTNKILASRIVALEELAASCGAPVSPSQILLDGYTTADLDQDMSRILNEQVEVEGDFSGVPRGSQTNGGSEKNCKPQSRTADEGGAGDASAPRSSEGFSSPSRDAFSPNREDISCHFSPLPPQVQRLLDQALEDLLHSPSVDELQKEYFKDCKDSVSKNASDKYSPKNKENINLKEENCKE